MIIGFVPVRCGSKSIPMKNIKMFCGKPLVYWCLKALQNCKEIDIIVVSTDCEEIKSIVSEFKIDKVVFHDRKAENALDESSTEAVMLEYLEEYKPQSSSLFVLVQATNPFIKSSDLEVGLNLVKSSNYDSVLSCSIFKRFIWDRSGQPINYDYRQRPRRQDFKGSLIENGAFYINSVGNILGNRNRLSGKIGIVEMADYTFHELDEPLDWELGEMIFNITHII